MLGVDDIQVAIDHARNRYHRLALLVGPSDSGKTALLRSFADASGHTYRNVNLGLAQQMLDLPRARRSRQADRIFRDWVAELGDSPLVLDNLEVLFDASLRLDPLRLLKASSRNRTVIASWNGSFQDGQLVYAEPDHPEYKSYRDVDIAIVSMGDEPPNH